MKISITSFLILIITCFIACNQSGQNNKPADALEAGRDFIDASLKGNYKDAERYILKDSVNTMYLDGMSDFYNKMDAREKEGYKNANIIIGKDGIQNLSDSVTIINYSNTFKNIPSKIKVIKVNGDWLVDFKYTLTPNK